MFIKKPQRRFTFFRVFAVESLSLLKYLADEVVRLQKNIENLQP
jgi:hypothetical protein